MGFGFGLGFGFGTCTPRTVTERATPPRGENVTCKRSTTRPGWALSSPRPNEFGLTLTCNVPARRACRCALAKAAEPAQAHAPRSAACPGEAASTTSTAPAPGNETLNVTTPWTSTFTCETVKRLLARPV